MKLSLKAIMLSGAAFATLGTASAETDVELEARIAALEELVASLSAQLAEERAETDADIVRLEAAQSAEAAPAAAPANGMMLGETNVTVGGFIDMDAHVTNVSDGAIGSSSIARDFYIPGAIPTGGEGSTTTDLTAEASRIFIAGNRDVGGRQVSGYFEMDFLGSVQGNERVSNSFSPRLRRAYLDFDGLRFGQDWSTFQNTSAIPESASFLVLSDGMIFMRQPMVRITRGNWQFALENGNATVTPVGGGRVEADSNVLPDLVGRYNFSGDFGNVSVAALARQLRYETTGIEEETFGYGISVSGRVNTGGRDDIRFSLTGGEGIGRYIGLNAANGAALDPATGELEAIPSVGGLIAWRHPFGETARINIGYSGLFIDNPDFVPTSMTQSVQSVYSAVLWDVAPRVTMGAEVLFGTRETEAGTSGDLSRFTFSTKYAF
ncbi:DcaP family trimeric outer membrane transporter [Ponticaulis sp.]|uniref:DcaP family trimeric outer membrane transporter n=1 Tax=Ponticaulis sp. TaxID=2020902 RepID=UPI0025DA9A02|nr:DcaP family trimeric outer membrane transporter [Ponticaulis sp.]